MTPDDDALRAILRQSRRIAVVGLSPNPARPSHRVAAYLQRAGYTIVPVHPAGQPTLGEPAYPDLRAVPGPIDVVDVFRRPETIPELVPALIAVRPTLVWLQLGIRHDDAARELDAAGIPIVMDRCLAVAHQSLEV